ASPVLCPRRTPFPARTTPKTADSPHAMARCGLSRGHMLVVWPPSHKPYAGCCAAISAGPGDPPDTPPQECRANGRRARAGSYQPDSPGYGVATLKLGRWAPPKKRWKSCWSSDTSMILVAVAVLPLTVAVTITW